MMGGLMADRGLLLVQGQSRIQAEVRASRPACLLNETLSQKTGAGENEGREEGRKQEGRKKEKRGKESKGASLELLLLMAEASLVQERQEPRTETGSTRLFPRPSPHPLLQSSCDTPRIPSHP